jgi:hypothetical protein
MPTARLNNLVYKNIFGDNKTSKLFEFTIITSKFMLLLSRFNNGPTPNRPMVMNDIYYNKTHLKIIEVVSFQRNTLNKTIFLGQKYSKTHVQNYRNSKIIREINQGPASTGREIGEGTGWDGKRKREGKGKGMKGRKWNGR